MSSYARMAFGIGIALLIASLVGPGTQVILSLMAGMLIGFGASRGWPHT